ncbi:MAG TPA: DUF2460 domain-containing protein [Rhizomicrobium sp.]
MSYPLYPPNLPGLGYSLVRRPKHCVSVQTHQSGGEVRLSYWSTPLWEWDLTYELLRDGFRNGAAYDELKQIEGLFLASVGNLNGFKFEDGDDRQVFRQAIGATNGTTSAFTLGRVFGSCNASDGFQGPYEPIGFLDTTRRFNLYVDASATPVDISDPVYGYTLSTAAPVAQQLVFNTAPPSGHALSVDMGFQFYARFAADSLDFEKFMHQLWALKKVTLMSLRF